MKKINFEKQYVSKKPYIIGFILSLVLTFEAFILTITHTANTITLLICVLSLAVVQLFVQLFCFLHLSQEKYPRWNLQFFVATLGIVLIVVIGSIWIMYHLNYNMTPQQMLNYTQNQQGF